MAQAAVEGKLTGDQCAFEHLGVQGVGGDEDTQGDGQVVDRAGFADRGGGEVDDDALAGVGESGVLDRRLDALAALLHGGVRQADDHHPGKPLAGIDFYIDDDTVESDDSAGFYVGEHGISLHENGRDVGGFGVNYSSNRGLASRSPVF